MAVEGLIRICNTLQIAFKEITYIFISTEHGQLPCGWLPFLFLENFRNHLASNIVVYIVGYFNKALFSKISYYLLKQPLKTRWAVLIKDYL